jgi:hypothetical protein
MIPRSTADHYRAGQRLTVVTVKAARRAWSAMGTDFDNSWRITGPRLTVLTSGAQLTAARESVAYVPLVLRETGQVDDPAGTVRPRSLVGFAADGRSLDGLLYGSVTHAKEAVASGASPSQALAQGGRWLDMAVQGIVADAARAAVGLGIASRPHIGGYVRMLNPPSCQRCAVLAGKFFKWNAGFQRHPRCDCRHIPASEDMAGDFRTDPRKAIESGNVHGISAADMKAITDGADIGQVINAHRGMSTANVYGNRPKITNEGTTRRGLAGKAGRGRAAPRLTPESIYELAGDDRAEALRLLRLHAYVI